MGDGRPGRPRRGDRPRRRGVDLPGAAQRRRILAERHGARHHDLHLLDEHVEHDLDHRADDHDHRAAHDDDIDDVDSPDHIDDLHHGPRDHHHDLATDPSGPVRVPAL